MYCKHAYFYLSENSSNPCFEDYLMIHCYKLYSTRTVKISYSNFKSVKELYFIILCPFHIPIM